MTKLIVSGDIHIHNFPHHNIEPNFRLNQFISLAHRLNEIGKENDANIFVIAGDLVHKALLTPEVAYTVQKFISILLKRYEVHYILGNHDIYSKSLSKSDRRLHSIVPIILDKYSKVFYADQQVVELPNGVTVGYRNWLPKQDFSFIEGKVDILIGHVTMHEKFGQDYDSSKYRLGIFGDIHNRSNIGHSYTTNVPIPHHISDDQDGSVILIDTEKVKNCKDEQILNAEKSGIIKRIDTESVDFKHLRIYYSNKVPKKHKKHPYLATYEVAEVSNTKDIKVTASSLSIPELIESVISDNELTEIHSKVSVSVPKTIEPLSLDFNLKSISISNFRSIDKFESDLDTGVLLLSGKNGSGKSSLIKAIKYGLTGQSRDFDKLVKHGSDNMEVTISLDYKSSNYAITRGVSNKKQYLEVVVDGKEVETSTFNQKEKLLKEMLPFLEYTYLFIKHEDDPPLLHSLNYDTRIKIISKLLGLDIISLYHEEAVSNQSKIKENIQSLISKKDTFISLLEDKKNKISAFNKEDILDKHSKVSEYINQTTKKLDNLKSKRKVAYNQQSILSEIDKTKSIMESIVIEDIPKPPEIDTNKIDLKISQLEAKLREGESFLLSLMSGLNDIENEIKATKNNIDSIERVCPTCGSELDKSKIGPIEEALKDRLSELEGLRKEQVEKISTFDSKFSVAKEKIRDSISKLNKERSLSDESVWSIYLKNEENKSKKQQLSDKLDSLNEQLNGLGDIIDRESLDEEYDKLTSTLQKLTDNLSKIGIILESFKEIEEYESKISALECSIPKLEEECKKYSTYVEIFKANGVIMKEVLNKLSSLLSTPEMKVITFKEMKNGKLKQELSIEYKVGDTYIPYNQLSGGQKTLSDLIFLTRLLDLGDGCRFMILDEYLKHLDMDNLELAVKTIKDSSIENVIIVTQLPELPYVDSVINVEFDEDSLTSSYV